MNRLKGNITAQILLAMVLALITGSVINTSFADANFAQNFLVNGWFYAIGSMFMGALKMMVVPLVVFGLATGVAGIGDINAMGRMGGKALALYITTTVIAITLGISAAATVGLGEGQDIMKAAESTFSSSEPPALAEIFINMVPSNPIQAMASGNMLAVIFFTLLFGLALALSGEEGRPLTRTVEAGNEVMLKMVGLIMRAAPIGIFCLMAKIFSENGIALIIPLLKYFVLMICVLALHAFGTYGMLLAFVGRVSPLRFFLKMRTNQLFAFSTASSSATIPVTLRNVEKNLGVDRTIASFTIPLGATLNMDGTAIMQGVATVFVANAYGIDLSTVDYLTVIGTATLASIGTAGVRGAGTIMLAMVFQQVGLPVEGIMLIMAVDPILDMIRTAVNVTGDATVTTLVAKSEGRLNLDTFNDPNAIALNQESIDLHHMGDQTKTEG